LRAPNWLLFRFVRQVRRQPSVHGSEAFRVERRPLAGWSAAGPAAGVTAGEAAGVTGAELALAPVRTPGPAPTIAPRPAEASLCDGDSRSPDRVRSFRLRSSANRDGRGKFR